MKRSKQYGKRYGNIFTRVVVVFCWKAYINQGKSAQNIRKFKYISVKFEDEVYKRKKIPIWSFGDNYLKG